LRELSTYVTFNSINYNGNDLIHSFLTLRDMKRRLKTQTKLTSVSPQRSSSLFVEIQHIKNFTGVSYRGNYETGKTYTSVVTSKALTYLLLLQTSVENPTQACLFHHCTKRCKTSY